MSDEENALVPAQPSNFKMPKFRNRASVLKQQLNKLNEEQDRDVID
jgi:hypothetical protein